MPSVLLGLEGGQYQQDMVDITLQVLNKGKSVQHGSAHR